MDKPVTCACGARHEGHLCVLKSKGREEDVAHLTGNPTVVCFTCGAEANSAVNVCNPVPLEG